VHEEISNAQIVEDCLLRIFGSFARILPQLMHGQQIAYELTVDLILVPSGGLGPALEPLSCHAISARPVVSPAHFAKSSHAPALEQRQFHLRAIELVLRRHVVAVVCLQQPQDLPKYWQKFL